MSQEILGQTSRGEALSKVHVTIDNQGAVQYAIA
jgi:hypothetical protein